MFKYKYFVTYMVRPNARTEGVNHALNLTFSGRLKNKTQAARLIKTLTTIHRVNPCAIQNINMEIVERVFLPLQWFKRQCAKLIGGQ